MGDDECTRALFVANLLLSVTAQDLTDLFEKKGAVDKIDLKNGFAFVYMKNQSEAEAAADKYQNYEWSLNPNRPLKVEWAKGDGRVKKREDGRKQAAQSNPCETLFVVNFDQETRERELEDLFEPFGKIKRVEIRRNYGFIQFDTVEAATEARLAINGKSIRGRELTVEYVARDQLERRGDRRSPRRDRNRSRSPRRDRNRSRSPRRDRNRSRSPRRDRDRDSNKDKERSRDKDRSRSPRRRDDDKSAKKR